MRLLIFFLLSLPLAAQVASQDIAVLFGRKPGMVRPGLTAAWMFQGTGTGQTVTSLPPPTLVLTRGANSGSSTDDPTPGDLGWTFDSGDRVSGLPAKGAAWTTTHCSGVECYTVDNTVDGEPRRNLLLWSEDLTNAAWTLANASFSLGTLTATANGNVHIRQAITTVAGVYSFTWRVTARTAPAVTVGLYDSSGSAFVARAHYTFATKAVSVVNGSASASDVAGGAVDITVTGTFAAGGSDVAYLYQRGVTDAVSGETVVLSRAQLELGSTATTYQRTTVSTGREYINGVARRNLLRWSEALDNAAWVKLAGVAVVADGTCPYGTSAFKFTAAAGTGEHSVRQTLALPAVAHSNTAVVKKGNYRYAGVRLDATGSVRSTYDFDTNTWAYTKAGDTALTPVLLDGGWVQLTIVRTGEATTYAEIGLSDINGSTTFEAAGTETIYGCRAQLNLGSTALEYQKTTDSREWALETPGNYTGLLTWWGRWDRVLNPGEVLNNYRAWLKPRINSVGNTLP